MTEFNSDITYKCISSPIIKCLETQDKGCKGFVKRQILTRIMALAISIFQAFDFLWNGACLVGKSVALLADKAGIGFVSKKTLATYSLKAHANGLVNCALGVIFGSVCSVLSPNCFVPYFFAPEINLFKDQVEPDQKYPFDAHFGKTFFINLASATERKDAMEKHLGAIGVNNQERFEAIRGSTLTDADLKRFLGYDVSVEALWKRMPGTNLKHKQGRVGCYLSQLLALKKAKAMGLKSVLILEDDVIFPQTSRGINIFNQAMRDLPRDWNLLYFGCGYDRAPIRHSRALNELHSGTGTYAFAINQNCYDGLIQDLEELIKDPNQMLVTCDERISEFLEKGRYKAYAVNPLLGVPRDDVPSTISGNVYGSESRISKAAQRIFAYGLAPMLNCIGLPKHRLLKILIRTGLYI